MGEVNVSFQIDTDNRENFSSAIAFHTFKKQRDAFYDILRIWEENHLVQGWVFQIALGGKIRNMLTLHNDCTNYYHIARLFKSQLLISCIQNGRQDDVVDDESLNFLKALKHVNPEKLTQLSKRFVTPLPSQSQSVGPSFPGMQEFFKDFILHAFNPIFYTHLENCFVHEIMELNDTQFANSEIEDSETMVDDQTQRNFITCLASLRLLAKVLGLLVSLPYRSESNTTKEILMTQVEIRSKVLPSLNLQACIQSAIVEGKLSLTIPWLVKYLAMMDIVSLRLPYYKQILELLYYIYHAINQTDLTASDCLISQQSAVLLKSSLCWLFELPNFPRDFYIAWQKTCKIKELKSLKQMEKFSTKQMEKKRNSHSADCAIPVKSSLDKLDIITDRTMRMCCPRVESTLSVFHGNGTSLNVNSNKHITPVTSQLRKLGGTTRAKHLELQLEEAFFHGQPASTRKTVDFVSERVASTCVKHICNTLLTSSREANLNSFRKILKHKNIERDSDEQGELSRNYFNEFKALLLSDMNTLANNASRELKDQCEKTIPTICETRVAASIESLLAEDSLTSVKEMCIKIATRMAMERINQWIQSHIAGDSLFIKDMELEINRFFRNSSPVHSNKQEKDHNTDAPSPTVIMDELRALMWHMLDNNGADLTISSVLDILDKLYQSFSQRGDLLPGPQKILYFLSLDFALFLVAYRTDLFTREVQDKLIKIWSSDNLRNDEDESPMHRILCSRNIILLMQPQNDATWPIFGKFLKKLLETNILDGDSLSDQCVALFRQDWPVPLLKLLSKCLSEAIEGYKANDEATEKVKYLLGWIAETYHEIEFCDDDDP
ncbi:codanin-1 [Temnothorax curvispinosus]|uniref:Codanin-1 n=1 Tax=Temnothorax curvispinosus TaxID=300111 RepID=A0A6J1Q0W4_9HYME|nr:codanin-1 [Temnothorax curvispinosus]XP_024875773.1 codanin-1 [Temnothorax curvispinosus]XP_024875774.1 codanin-1 [Temnothorax curvispinosus]